MLDQDPLLHVFLLHSLLISIAASPFLLFFSLVFVFYLPSPSPSFICIIFPSFMRYHVLDHVPLLRDFLSRFLSLFLSQFSLAAFSFSDPSSICPLSLHLPYRAFIFFPRGLTCCSMFHLSSFSLHLFYFIRFFSYRVSLWYDRFFLRLFVYV